VRQAAAAADAGEDAATIVGLVHQLTPTVHTYAMLDTLDHLRRGGRLGGAAALIGTMLSVKPVVTLRSGRIDLAARPRTRRRAMEWMRDQLVLSERDHHLLADVTVLHSMDPDGGPATGTDRLVDLLTPLVAPGIVELCPVGAVIASHSGPGMIGVSWRTITPPVF
jgi:DegV family protein with EDD domain